MGKLALTFHIFVLMHHLHVVKFANVDIDFSSVTDSKILHMKEYRFRYLTTWNLIIQQIYLVLAILSSVLELMPTRMPSLEKKLRVLNGYIFTSFVFPFTLFVTCMFWTIFTIDRELIFPKVVDAVIPSWVNHSLHTNILLLLVIEIFLNNKTIPSYKNAVAGCAIMTILYNVLLVFTYFEKSVWLYGIFDVLGWPERIAFFSFTVINAFIVTKIGIVVQKYLTCKQYRDLRIYKNVLKKVM